MTVEEIKQKLDELGVEYNNRVRKDKLLKLLNEHSETVEEKEAEKPKQKAYNVVYRFKDTQDNNKVYRPGDKFNYVGKSKDRIQELSSTNNKIGKVLIKEVE